MKTADGTIVEEGRLKATHQALREWAAKRQEPWHGAMEATLFSGWIYDVLKPFAARVGDGEPVDDESHQSVVEEERSAGCTEDCRPGAVQSAAACYVASVEMRELRRLLRYRNTGSGACGTTEEQDEWVVDGSGRRVQQTTTTRQTVFQRADRPVGGSAGVGERYAAAKSQRAGDVRDDAAATTEPATERARV